MVRSSDRCAAGSSVRSTYELRGDADVRAGLHKLVRARVASLAETILALELYHDTQR